MDDAARPPGRGRGRRGGDPRGRPRRRARRDRLFPLVATADRWDIGGVSTALHPDTGLPTILVYDGYPGGAGFAHRGYRAAATWPEATADAIEACRCERGCPSCVQSPKCGNGNEPLDKPGALAPWCTVLSTRPHR